MKLAVYCVAIFLAACDSPSPGYKGVPGNRVEVGNFLFSVRVQGANAEAIRLRPGSIPRYSDLIRAGAIAIEVVSGCAIAKPTTHQASLGGDQAVVWARLDC